MIGPEPSHSHKLDLSPSVSNAVKRVGLKKPIRASTLAQAIFEMHGEYAGGSAASLRLEDTPSTRTTQEWLDKVQALFDPERIQSFSKYEAATEQPLDLGYPTLTLHGRRLVIGLSLLEPRLREQLESAGAFTALVKELQEPLQDILSERGRALYESEMHAKLQRDFLDSVPNWTDDPLLLLEQDLLGRAAFARFLAKRIAAIALESGAYSIHVYGPWGAGKSTLLNFIGKELEKQKAEGSEWLVVEFNAWRHQHIEPPWWSLMEAIFKQTKDKLSFWERLQEYWWRFNTGRLQYIFGAVLLAWLLALVVVPLLGSTAEGTGWLKYFADNAEHLSKILALVATVWGGILAFNHSLLLGSAKAAQSYSDLTNDPTNEIKRRFTGLIKRLLPARVAILIDDLDRCQSRYVVDLLEGVQTLFREAPVVFVVAADRHWLNACYEEVYEKLRARIHEPGKPLGALFQEKAFRFSTPMPGLPDELKESYWRHLLQLAPSERSAGAAAAREKARDDVTKARSESEVRSLIDSSRKRPFLEQRALREEAVVRLAAPDVLQRLEHTLTPYGPLLEPNPRAMKLLVNSYSANRALAILSEVEIELHQLALWTILCARWPQLADYLAKHPEMLEKLGEPNSGKFPDDLKALCTDPGVIQVIKGDSIIPPKDNNRILKNTVTENAQLSIETLKQCARMRS